jgi:serine/threonine-protein kinase HipA
VLDQDGHQLIAKFPHHHDEWDVMAWEATALDLAAAAGASVPLHRLVRIEGRHVLLLERFDRTGRAPSTAGNTRGSTRVGYMSAMTLLGYRDGDHADYVDIADSLAEVSAQAKEDARQLFRRVAVSVGLNNTDDHLRNHGFLHGRGGWRLSPVFDVNPNPDLELRQTTIAGADLPADEAGGLLEFARSCRLTPAEARAELTQVGEALSRWRDLAVENSVPQSQLARFEDSFQAGLGTLRRA